MTVPEPQLQVIVSGEPVQLAERVSNMVMWLVQHETLLQLSDKGQVTFHYAGGSLHAAATSHLKVA